MQCYKRKIIIFNHFGRRHFYKNDKSEELRLILSCLLTFSGITMSIASIVDDDFSKSFTKTTKCQTECQMPSSSQITTATYNQTFSY